jgi:hypothetical protein
MNNELIIGLVGTLLAAILKWTQMRETKQLESKKEAIASVLTETRNQLAASQQREDALRDQVSELKYHSTVRDDL